jgi:hypothetical protein
MVWFQRAFAVEKFIVETGGSVMIQSKVIEGSKVYTYYIN